MEETGGGGPIGVYPGSFDPLTIAHLHVAETAVHQCGLVRVDLSISTVTLGKDDDRLTPIEDRLSRISTLALQRPWLGARRTPARLLADIADGYDVVVVGADKWHQLLDPGWYASPDARLEALARLPIVAVAPRPPWPRPGETGPDGTAAGPAPEGVEVVLLDTDPAHHDVSATAVRQGRDDWRATP